MRSHDLANDEEPEAKAARAPVALLEGLEQKGEHLFSQMAKLVADDVPQELTQRCLDA
jgi:hypothetical protein